MSYVILCVLATLLPSIRATIQPAADARTFFGREFFIGCDVILNPFLKNNLIISPAAVQKFLTVIYGGTEAEQADRMLFDFGVKHIDYDRLKDAMQKESKDSAIERLIRELDEPCAKEDVLKYFEDDFANTNDSILIENIILVPVDLTPRKEFVDFAQKYFYTTIIAKKELSIHKNIELLSKIKIATKFNGSYTSSNGAIDAVVEAKYFEDKKEGVELIELPLENGLTLLIMLPSSVASLKFYINNYIFNGHFEDKGQTEKLHVQLPKLDIECNNNLTKYFEEPDLIEGISSIFDKDAKMTEAFENWPENGLKAVSFNQIVDFKLHAADNANGVKLPSLKPFNAVGVPFFFIVKNEKSLYIMGYYRDPNTSSS